VAAFEYLAAELLYIVVRSCGSKELLMGDSNNPDESPLSVEQKTIVGDQVYGDQIVGDKVGGDKITVGDVGGSHNAIGAGAQVIVTQSQQALSAVDEMEKGIQVAERRLAAAIRQKIVRYAHLTAPAQINAQENPYKALLDYKLEDAPFFYGRSQAVQVIRQKMSNGRLTILHFESGSGKTSLLQAGLASRVLGWERKHDEPHTPPWSTISEIHRPGTREPFTRERVPIR
jgi:hypothetical protein